MKAKDKEKL